jgi:hypothetical protein
MSRQRREHEPSAEAWGRVPGVRRGRLTDAEIVYLELFLPEPQYITERHVIPLLAPHLQVRYVADDGSGSGRQIRTTDGITAESPIRRASPAGGLS